MLKLKKNTYKTWMAALLLVMATLPSCEKVALNVTFDEVPANTLTLNLVCSENQSSRAADNTNNEDAIHRLDIFLYPENATFDTQAVVHKTINNISSNASHTESLSLTNDEINALFDESGTTCRIYAIANRPDATTWVTEETSVNQLKALTITAAFNTFKPENGISVYQPQTDFVMDSDFIIDGNNDLVTLDRNTHKLTGTVPLYRAASKISLEITEINDVILTNENNEPVYEILTDGSYRTEPNSINENPIKWVANTTGIQVRLHDGVKNGFIDYSKQSSDEQKLDDADYYSFYNSENKTSLYVPMEKADDETSWKHNPAFYSYSSNWGEGGSDKDPYLTLIVPWQLSTKTNSYESTYYQIPINTITKKLERNTHYKISLVVSRLGSLIEEKPEVISPSSYIIVSWESETVNADLMDYRYLMVEEKEITIYNENELYIPYVTSHEAEIDLSTVEFFQQNIKGASPSWDPIGTNSSNRYSNLELVETASGKQIYFNNVLDNVYTSSTFDFTPYKLEFTIQHIDNSAYFEKVTIIQYPAIYGEVEQNWDYSNDYNGQTGTDGNNGFTYVNGYQADDNGDYDFFGTVNGLSGNSSSSPNQYVFTITSVEGTPYVIGDPRDNTITYDEDDAKWAVAKALYDGTRNRELKYYYGTDVTSELYTTRTNTNSIYANDAAAEAAERTINMIAPKFRIASGYAVLGTGASEVKILENLKKRCASYQEDGYPAGRWRLPTKAEFEFIVSQVNRENLPQIYIDDTPYWCAHGVGTPDQNGIVTMKYVARDGSGHSVRCVYDEWYWANKLETPAEKNVFTWGDQPR